MVTVREAAVSLLSWDLEWIASVKRTRQVGQQGLSNSQVSRAGDIVVGDKALFGEHDDVNVTLDCFSSCR